MDDNKTLFENVSPDVTHKFYLSAKKHFDFLVGNDAVKRKELRDAITEYEGKNEILGIRIN